MRNPGFSWHRADSFRTWGAIRVSCVVAFAATAALGLAAAASAGSAPSPNACYSVDTQLYIDEVVTVSGAATSLPLLPGGTFGLGTASVTVTTANLLEGYNIQGGALGLLAAGPNTVGFSGDVLLEASNTVEATQAPSFAGNATITVTDPDGMPNTGDETISPPEVSFPLATSLWTHDGDGDVEFAETQVALIVSYPAPSTGGFDAGLICQPGSVDVPPTTFTPTTPVVFESVPVTTLTTTPYACLLNLDGLYYDQNWEFTAEANPFEVSSGAPLDLTNLTAKTPTSGFVSLYNEFLLNAGVNTLSRTTDVTLTGTNVLEPPQTIQVMDDIEVEIIDPDGIRDNGNESVAASLLVTTFPSASWTANGTTGDTVEFTVTASTTSIFLPNIGASMTLDCAPGVVDAPAPSGSFTPSPAVVVDSSVIVPALACPDPPAIFGGNATCSPILEGASCTAWTCDPGRVKIGADPVCEADGSWSGDFRCGVDGSIVYSSTGTLTTFGADTLDLNGASFASYQSIRGDAIPDSFSPVATTYGSSIEWSAVRVTNRSGSPDETFYSTSGGTLQVFPFLGGGLVSNQADVAGCELYVYVAGLNVSGTQSDFERPGPHAPPLYEVASHPAMQGVGGFIEACDDDTTLFANVTPSNGPTAKLASDCAAGPVVASGDGSACDATASGAACSSWSCNLGPAAKLSADPVCVGGTWDAPPLCAATLCGNGQLDAGESCDDGNVLDGDCCSSSCSFEPALTACDADSSLCTVADACDGTGTCVAGPPLVCSDGNVCTDDTCDPALGCVFPNNSDACEDGDACTTSDVCSGGACTPGAPLVCDDGVVCNGAESCNPASGCVAGSAPDADDGIACTIDSCVEPGGVAHVPDDGLCDDGDACTADSCDEFSGCVNTAIPGCAPLVSEDFETIDGGGAGWASSSDWGGLLEYRTAFPIDADEPRHVRTSAEFAFAFRDLDPAVAATLNSADDVWLGFMTRLDDPKSLDQFGGVSLWGSATERYYLGASFFTTQWSGVSGGFEDPTGVEAGAEWISLMAHLDFVNGLIDVYVNGVLRETETVMPVRDWDRMRIASGFAPDNRVLVDRLRVGTTRSSVETILPPPFATAIDGSPAEVAWLDGYRVDAGGFPLVGTTSTPDGIAVDAIAGLIYTAFASAQEVIAYDFDGVEQFSWTGAASDLRSMTVVGPNLAIGGVSAIDLHDSQSGALVDTLPTPCTGSDAEGLAYDGTALWVVCGATLEAIHPATGASLSSMPNAASACAGVLGMGLTSSAPTELTVVCSDGQWFRVGSADGALIDSGSNGLPMRGVSYALPEPAFGLALATSALLIMLFARRRSARVG